MSDFVILLEKNINITTNSSCQELGNWAKHVDMLNITFFIVIQNSWQPLRGLSHSVIMSVFATMKPCNKCILLGTLNIIFIVSQVLPHAI